jgi:magnesium transporter
MQVSSRTLKKLGMSSDSLFYTGVRPDKDVMLTLFNYDKASYGKKLITDLSNINSLNDTPGVKWLNVDGIHDVDIVETIGFQFGIDFLVLEDILDVNQRPKVEDHHKYVYIVLKMVYNDTKLDKIVSEQVSIIFMKNLIITFQEQLGYDVFDPIRNRIVNNRGKIRKEGADFLVYSLIDSIIDNYISVTDDISEEIADIEKQVLTAPTKETLEDIYSLKLDIIFYRNAIWPVREVIIQLQKIENGLFKPALAPYYRDVYDHTLQAIDTIKIYNDTISEILGIYSSSIANKTNEIIQRLTFITTIFMPLSVIAGIGGMSEWSMMTGPQNWKISYPLFVMILAAIAIVTYIILKRMYRKAR